MTAAKEMRNDLDEECVAGDAFGVALLADTPVRNSALLALQPN